jgi:hypothetical protein
MHCEKLIVGQPELSESKIQVKFRLSWFIVAAGKKIAILPKHYSSLWDNSLLTHQQWNVTELRLVDNAHPTVDQGFQP